MVGFLDTGVSGLLSFQRALATTGHNITNANTPGFSRQRVDLATRQSQEFGNGFVGKGVFVRDIQRISNQFVTLQLQQASAENSRLNTFSSLTGQVNSLLADEEGGLSPRLNSFFNGVQELSNDPGSIPARQVMLSQAQSLVERINFLGQQLDDQTTNVNSQVIEVVQQVNTIAENIAALNEVIIRTSNNSVAAEPNDLLDQRDQQITELSNLVAVSTVQGDNGAINVFIGNGQQLVFDTSVQSVTALQDPANFTQLGIGYQTSGGALDITSQLSGGALGGLLDYRREVVLPTQNEIGRIAMTLADTFNSQHRQGMDLNNNLGGDFFNVPAAGVIINQSNTGAATVTATITDVTALSASDYRLSYDGANYTLTRLSDSVSVSGAGPLSMDGVDVAIAGAAVAGDSFLVRPTATAAADLSLALTNLNSIAAASPIRTGTAIGNLGEADIAFGQVLDVTNTDLLDTVEIIFNDPPTDFDIINMSDATTIASGVVYTPGNNIDFNGVRVSVSGAPVAGDRFTIEHNIGGVSDNRNALALAALQIEGFVDGTASYQEAYATTISRVGTLANQAEVNGLAQTRLLEQAQQRRDSISGVNLDEEAADLVRYQQAYEAAAQVIAVSDTLFQTLLNSVR